MIRKDNFLEILNPGNVQQLALSAMNGQISKVNDKYSQSEVLSLGKNGKLGIPRTNRQHLNISNQYLILQIFIPQSKSFILELGISDSSITRRKLIFTHCRGIQKDTLHSKISNAIFPRDIWTNICINLAAFTAICFNYGFNEIDSISISGFCKIRRIFSSKMSLEDIKLPKNYEFPGNSINTFVEPPGLDDTCLLLDISKKGYDENSKIIEKNTKIHEEKKAIYSNGLTYKSSSHIPNSRMNYTHRKQNYLKPLEKVESLYQNMLNSLGNIRPSTPPFVHLNQDPLYYDPITKSYIS